MIRFSINIELVKINRNLFINELYSFKYYDVINIIEF